MSFLEWAIAFAILGMFVWITYDRRRLTKVVNHQITAVYLLKRHDLSRKVAQLVRQDRIVNGEHHRLKDQWRS